MAPPEGLIVGGDGSSSSRKPQWKVGKRIGEGACASVHVLLDNNDQDTSYVIKIVPLPSKTTRKKATIPERNARLLHYEELVYKTQFSNYQGWIIPKLSPYIGPPSYGEVDGKL